MGEDLEELLTKPHAACGGYSGYGIRVSSTNSSSQPTFPLNNYSFVCSFVPYPSSSTTASVSIDYVTSTTKYSHCVPIEYNGITYYGYKGSILSTPYRGLSSSTYYGFEWNGLVIKAIILNTISGIRTTQANIPSGNAITTRLTVTTSQTLLFKFPIADDEYLLYAEITDAN